jgi:hypothetical protein
MEKFEIHYDQIKKLLAEKKFKEAIALFDSINKINPFDKRTIKAKRLVYESIEKENQDKIEKAIKKAEDLIKEKDYKSAIIVLKSFIKIAPNHKKLSKTIKQAQSLYKNQLKIAQEIFEEREAKALTKSFNLNTKDFLKELIEFKRKHNDNPLALNFLEKAKIFYIHNKIEKNTELLKSKKYDLIENFINDLRTISENNPEILKLEKKIRLEKFETQSINLKESIYEAEQNIETLLKLKKFQKAYKASKELLNQDNKNKKGLEFLKISKEKIIIINKIKTRKLIIENLENLQNQYKENPLSFKKI